ncbi:hypothetical protein [Xanthobacter agilis]|jgi:hypothetical protein|uniref:Uncharacterized protein n=1 Tax=Xanthobacter agilis TaxID=47492 RepID=A0ABU0LH53_XANAG|nr:hypothetical protein [Xanthobacter agilis]MDQ0506417.1 hypothetical protein [Xanthobacter agilis]
MRTPAPSPAPDLPAFARDLVSGPDPEAMDAIFMFRRIQTFGEPKRDVRWPTYGETRADASDGEIRGIALQYSVPAIALLALATLEGRRSRDHVEDNAARLKGRLEAGAALADVLEAPVLDHMTQMGRQS